jgi:hypothetical protein
MTQLELVSETPINHKIVFRTPASFKDKLTSAYDKEKDNLAIIDKYINDFNKQNNNNILEYNYEINTETNFNVCVLFKHLFRAIGETQKCARCNVDIGNNEVNIKFDSNIDIDVKTKTKFDHLPLASIRASYVVDGDELINTIEYETLDDVSTYKCYTMLTTMIQDGIMNVVDDIEKTDM